MNKRKRPEESKASSQGKAKATTAKSEKSATKKTPKAAPAAVAPKKFKRSFSNEEYWKFSYSKKQKIRREARKAGVEFDAGPEPSWHQEQRCKK